MVVDARFRSAAADGRRRAELDRLERLLRSGASLHLRRCPPCQRLAEREGEASRCHVQEIAVELRRRLVCVPCGGATAAPPVASRAPYSDIISLLRS